MQINELGEFGVINILKQMVIGQRSDCGNAQDLASNLIVDNGDDAAAWAAGRGQMLFTTDTMIEDVHFTRQTISWHDLGWKSVASNISDVASMGGLPAYALITLGLPSETVISDLESLYQGMLEISNEYGMAIVGGDMVRSPVMFITVALTGVMDGQPMVRTGALPGDLVAVTGYLGNSGGGLRLMLEGKSQSSKDAQFLCDSHRRPSPAVAVGQSLLDSNITTAMDVSDGLVDDLSKLCCASSVSGRIFTDRLPIHASLNAQFPDDSIHLALSGGEDYVLMFTGQPSKVNRIVSELPVGASIVGEITEGQPGNVEVLDANGQEMRVVHPGWDHFDRLRD